MSLTLFSVPRLSPCFLVHDLPRSISIALVLVLLSAGAGPSAVAQTDTGQTAEPAAVWPASVMTRLTEGGGDYPEIRKAMKACPADQRDELAFLIAHMPQSDLETLSAEFLLENIRLACEARDAASWKIDDALFFNDVLPYASVDETRERWRPEMVARCRDLVAACQTPGEAALVLNRELFPLVNVRYSTSREKANQSPAESIRQSVASCTGLSILLVDACRSVGVPARLAGTAAWTHKRGNHTWVEIWDDGAWHYIGAAEPDERGLNHAWFTGDAAQADPSRPINRIYATSFARTGLHFPLVWSMRDHSVPAVDVTARYAEGADPVPQGHTRVYLSVVDFNNTRLAVDVSVSSVERDQPWTGTTRAGTADMNDLLELDLPQKATYRVRFWHGERWHEHELVVEGHSYQQCRIQIGKQQVDDP